MSLADLTTPATKNLNVVRGDSFRKEIVVKESGTPIVLTGWTPKAQIRDRPNGRLLAEFDVSSSDLPNGQIVLALTDTQTVSLWCSEGVWDLEIRQDASSHHTLLTGVVTFFPDVTR